MGKKVKRAKFTSKGERPNVTASTLKMVHRERDPFEHEMNLIKAWRKGSNPWITVQNPERKTNRPYFRVRANDYWGSPKRGLWNIYAGKKRDA